MSLKYKLAARPNPRKKEEIKIYAVAINSGELTMDQVSKNIERTSTATRGDVRGIALAFTNCLISTIQEGKSLYLEDLGFFRAGISSQGAETADKYTPSLITDKYINYQPKGDIKTLKGEITFERVGAGVETTTTPTNPDSGNTGGTGGTGNTGGGDDMTGA